MVQPSRAARSSQMAFNILCGNTDNHARNHAAFWEKDMLTLTPAYHICPHRRSEQETASLFCPMQRNCASTRSMASSSGIRK